MQISSRFTIATHMLVIIALKGKESKVTSDFLASSVGVNPVIIRKTLSQLKKADLISVARGTGGAEIIKNLEDISLLDIYQAVECLGKRAVARKPPTDQTTKRTRQRVNGMQALNTDKKPIEPRR